MASSPHVDEDIDNKRPCHIMFRDIILAAKADEARSKSSSQAISPSTEEGPIAEEADSSEPAKRLSILHLPSETLLQIAVKLCGTNAIVALSQTNKHMHQITNEAIAKKLVVRPSDMKTSLDWLARHPDMMTRVNAVDVSAFQPMHNVHEDDSNASTLSVANFSSDVSQVLRVKIWANTGRTAGKETWLSSLRIDDNSIWGDRHQACLDILFSICLNIKTLKVSMPAAKRFDQNPSNILLQPLTSTLLPIPNPTFEPVTPLQGVSLQLARNYLRSLTIAPSRRWTGPPQSEWLATSSDVYWRGMGKHAITLHGFDKLEHLDVPMDDLGLPQTLLFQALDELVPPIVRLMIKYSQTGGAAVKTAVDFPAKVLPLSLRSIQLRSSNQQSFGFLRKLSEAPSESDLEHVELYLNECARSIILRCLEASDITPGFLAQLTKLERLGVAVKFYTGVEDNPIDMKQELTIMGYLKPEEVGLISLSGRQFSDLNLAAISRRQCSRLARRMYTRHALAHFDLFNSPNFEAKYWTDIAFFHGAETTKYHPDLGSKSTRPPTTTRPGAHAIRNHGKNLFLDLDNFKFTLRVYSTPRSDLSLEKKVWLMGQTNVLYGLWFPARIRVVKHSKKRQCKNVAAIKEFETKYYGPTEGLGDNIAKHTKVSHPSVYRKGAVEQLKESDVTIDGVSYQNVDWKFHLRAHL